MYESFLQVITAKNVQSITNNKVYNRGVSYYEKDHVHDIKYNNGKLTAWVRGNEPRPYAVEIVSDEAGICFMDCTCFYASDGETCKHIVATFLKWIDKRGKVRRHKPLVSRQKTSLTSNNPPAVDLFSATFSTYEQQGVTNILNAAIFDSDQLHIKVDLLNGGPQLELKLSSHGNDVTVIHVSREKSPCLFEKLGTLHDRNLELSERARKTKLYKTPLVPYLHADINTEGHVELSPVVKIKGSNKANQSFQWEQLAENRINHQWVWINNSYRPIEPIPRYLEPYFYKLKPLVYKEKGAVDFFKKELNQLLTEPAFKPSPKLQQVKVHDNLDISHVKVETSDKDWLWLDASYKIGRHTVELSEILSCIENGRYMRKDTDYIEVPEDLMELWQRGKGIIENGRLKMPKLGYLRARTEWGNKVTVNPCSKTQKFLMNFDRITPPQPGPSVSLYEGELRNYQQKGYDWLWFLHMNEFNGILADEMGLGKTHQAMMMVLSALQTDPSIPNLIICPTSVLDHWESKFQTYAPTVKLARFYGKERKELFSGALPSIVLTTYSILSRDLEELCNVQWNYVVLDEAQKIKNHKTQMSKAVRRLRARRRLALTGTPLENRLMELWSIFDFLLPGYLGTMIDFRKQYENPIVKFQDTRKKETLKKIIHPFKLRRLKKDVLTELPPKIEEKRYCNLLPAQIALYKDMIHEQGSKLIMKLRDESQPVEYMHIFALLTKLKQLCDHPKLVMNGRGLKKATSGKFELFKGIMEEAIGSEEKIVVFSQYLQMLDIIGSWLQDIGVGYESLRGNTKNRGKVIERFQKDSNCSVFLCSLLAGGLGIDLTAASVVIHYDRWWNAAREDQATDRVHRIGQTGGVQVFKLITRGTLEEKIDTMITTKARLMDSVIESDDIMFKAFSRKEFLDLLAF
ncbi:MAG: DEAD/DEAH box helicase [Candidatus Brocadiaceae bacterium]|nr:DEAD/DEAH box helicase [Candidatus Brocadiaceae bacterium]